jgi:hypothetical protein
VHDATATVRELVAVNFMLRDLVASLLDDVAAQDPARYRRIASSLHRCEDVGMGLGLKKVATEAAGASPYDLEAA